MTLLRRCKFVCLTLPALLLPLHASAQQELSGLARAGQHLREKLAGPTDLSGGRGGFTGQSI